MARFVRLFSIDIDIDKAIVRDYLMEYFFPKGDNGIIRFKILNKVKPQVSNALIAISTLLKQKNVVLAGKQLNIADALLAPMLHYLSI